MRRLDYLALAGRKMDLTGQDIPEIEEVDFDGGGNEVTSLSGSRLEPVARSLCKAGEGARSKKIK